MQLFVFIRKNTNIFKKQRHLCIFLDFPRNYHATIRKPPERLSYSFFDYLKTKKALEMAIERTYENKCEYLRKTIISTCGF